MHSLLNQLELAVKNVVDAGLLGIATFIGQDAHAQVRPCVTIYSQDGEEKPIGSGNFLISVAVEVRSNASDTSIEQHRQRCDDVFGLLMLDDLGEILSANANLTVFNPVIDLRASHGRDEGSWISKLEFDCYSCLLDLA